jgi:hypothetical protein
MFASFESVIQKVPHLVGDDAQFLRSIFERFPHVHSGFKDFSDIAPWLRIKTAAERLENKPRKGWDRLGVAHISSDVLRTHAGEYHGSRWFIFDDTQKKGETVLRHSIELAELFCLIFKKEPHLQLAVEVLKFHDFVEAINGDFTPHDPITKDEKSRLEKIALNLLTESRDSGDLVALHVYNCMRIFEGDLTDFAPARDRMLTAIDAQPANRNKPFVAFIRELYSRPLPDLSLLKVQAKDIDTVQMGVCGIRIIRDEYFTTSREIALQKMEEFWSYIEKKLTTHECRIFFEELTDQYRNADHLDGRTSILYALGSMEIRMGWQNLSHLRARPVA